MVDARSLLIDATVIETRVALCDAGGLIALRHFPNFAPERASARPGAVFAARVAKRIPSLAGAIVDLGAAGEGVLRTRNAPGDGTFLIARVTQSAMREKLPVLAPLDVAERAAFDPQLAERRARLVLAPSALDRARAWAAVAARVLVDSDDPRAFTGEPQLAHAEMAQPGLFEREGVEAEIEAALEAIVPLPSGGRLIIDETAALTAIDVDAGAGSASEANAAAAARLPREIARRGLAGTIVADFAQIRRTRELAPLKERLAAGAIALDLALEIDGAGRGGVVLMRVPRGEAPLAAALTRAGLTHHSIAPRLTEAAQLARLARVIRASPDRRRGSLSVRAEPGFARYLEAAGARGWEAIRSAALVPLRLTVDEGLKEGFDVAQDQAR